VSVTLSTRAQTSRMERVIGRAPWLPWLVAGAAFWLVTELAAASRSPLADIRQHELKGVVAVGLLLPAVFGDSARGAIRRLLASAPLRWGGIVSYGIYLWHLPVLYALDERGVSEAGAPVFIGVALLLTLTLAALSYALVERPALAAGRRLASEHQRRSAPMAVPRESHAQAG
jgi:peptidoglycan/LPS O-acetylase OafA/YrhL